MRTTSYFSEAIKERILWMEIFHILRKKKKKENIINQKWCILHNYSSKMKDKTSSHKQLMWEFVVQQFALKKY